MTPPLVLVRLRIEWNQLLSAASAFNINQAQDLSGIKVGLDDEIFQGSQPVLAGVDASSTYCYLHKSLKELITGESHAHWLELLGFQRFRRA